MVIILGLLCALAVSGYWLMKPTVLANPGVAAYRPPAANVLLYGGETKSIAADRAATEVADQENRKLGLAPTVIAGAKSKDHAAVVAATPKQTTVQKRQDAPGQNQAHVARPEPPAQSAFAQRWFGLF